MCLWVFPEMNDIGDQILTYYRSILGYAGFHRRRRLLTDRADIAHGEENAAKNGPLPKALNRSSSPYRVSCLPILTKTNQVSRMRTARKTRKLKASTLLRYSKIFDSLRSS